MLKMKRYVTATPFFLVLSDMMFSNAFMHNSQQNILTAIKSKRIITATKNTVSS